MMSYRKKTQSQIVDKVYLEIPFKRKDEAKKLGAMWDKEKKSWFVSKDDHELFLLKFTKSTKLQREYNFVLNASKNLTDVINNSEFNLSSEFVDELKKEIEKKNKILDVLLEEIKNDHDVEYYINLLENR